jgi:glycine betaine/proline transport system ATP-binding protein
VDDKLELVGLTQWRNKKPDELSGGMQQRVGLARALAMDADILLMDEPFSALDPLIRQGLQDELLELQRKLSKTIVFVSHDLDEALKLGSRIAIMKDGRIIQYSVPEEIVLNPADDYVRTFVAHTNPLNVLCGRSLMRTLDNCKRINGSVCLDPGGDSWLDLAEGNTIKGARQNGSVLDLQNWAPGKRWKAGRGRRWWTRTSACAMRCRFATRPATNWCCTTTTTWWGFWATASCTTRCWARTWGKATHKNAARGSRRFCLS